MKTCLSEGDEAHLIQTYHDVLEEQKRQCDIALGMYYHPSRMVANEREKAMHAYFRVIIMLGYPLCHVHDPELLSFSRHDTVYGI